MRRFDLFAAIDWSGASGQRQPGIAIAVCAAGDDAPLLIAPGDGGRHWSRGLAMAWLLDRAREGVDMLIGMDLSPALPFADAGGYFPGATDGPADARALWALVERECADEPHLAAAHFALKPQYRAYFRVQQGRVAETGELYGAGAGRLRVVEHRQRLADVNPVSCFNMVGAAQVGKSSLTAMRMFHRMAGTVPVWPFDPVPDKGPLIVEIYTAIAARQAGLSKGRSKIHGGAALDAALASPKLGSRPHRPLARYDDHRTDAILTAAWLRRVAENPAAWHPQGIAAVRHTEGWTFGVM